jgi:hypothetical protein
VSRIRRTKAEMNELASSLLDIIEQIRPATVRQVFYQATVQGLIPKTEEAYNGVIVRLLLQMREDGRLPWHYISDNTRWVHRSAVYGNLTDLMNESAQFYRRDLWVENPNNVEVWLEKEALAGTLMDVTDPLRVKLFVSRGFSSASYLHSAAENIKTLGKHTIIYQLGDHDPSGIWIAKTVERRLREYGADIEFHRLAVTPEQIGRWNLPSRPTKRKGNSHAKNFKGASVELDAIEPARLRDLVNGAIVQHIDPRVYEQTMKIEEAERATLAQIAKGIT